MKYNKVYKATKTDYRIMCIIIIIIIIINLVIIIINNLIIFFIILYLPTPPLGQDMTQGQFFSGV